MLNAIWEGSVAILPAPPPTRRRFLYDALANLQTRVSSKERPPSYFVQRHMRLSPDFPALAERCDWRQTLAQAQYQEIRSMQAMSTVLTGCETQGPFTHSISAAHAHPV